MLLPLVLICTEWNPRTLNRSLLPAKCIRPQKVGLLLDPIVTVATRNSGSKTTSVSSETITLTVCPTNKNLGSVTQWLICSTGRRNTRTG